MAPPGDVRRAHRRRADRRRAEAPVHRRRLLLDDAPAGGLPRQPVRGRVRHRLRRRSARSTSRPRCMRFANRVPLQYQPKACAISEAVYELNWKNYGLSQPRGSLPDRADGDLRAPRERVGSVHQRGQGGGRALPRAAAGDHARAPGVRPQARASSARASARSRARASARASSSATSPSSAQSLGKITGQDREDIEKSFLKALPNFVNLAEITEDDGPKAGGGGGRRRRRRPTPAAASTEARRRTAPRRRRRRRARRRKEPATPSKKAPRGKKGEQLSLLE